MWQPHRPVRALEFELLPLSDPGHKKFGNVKQAACLVCGKPKKDV